MKRSITEEAILGEVLKSFRIKANKTQEVLALDAGLDRTYISMLERGEASPTLKSLRAVSKALETPLVDIIAEFELRLKD